MTKTSFQHLFSTALLSLFLSGCLGNPPATRNKPQVVESMSQALAKKNPQVSHITAQKLHQWKEKERNLLLIDARSSRAWKMSHIPDALPLDQLSEHKDTAKILVIYDTIGVRAIDVIQKRNLPSENVYNLKGGLLSWIHQGHKLIDKEGKDSKEVYLESEAWNFLPETYRAHVP